MTNVLITGGAGFIGKSMTKQLIEAGYSVSILDNLHPQVHGANPNLTEFKETGVRIYSDCITNIDQYFKLVDDSEIIIHLAAETGTGQSGHEISRYCSTNVLGTAKLVETINKSKKRNKLILLASSRSVYGEGSYVSPTGMIINHPRRANDNLGKGIFRPLNSSNEQLMPVATSELAPCDPISVYAATKLQQEQILQLGLNQAIARAIIFRLQNVFGAGQSLRNPYTGIASIFINQARQNSDIHLYESGLPSRDFVYIDDVVRAFQLSLNNNIQHGEVINIGSGVSTTISDVACAAVKFVGSKSKIKITKRFRKGDIFANFACTKKANRLLDFDAHISFSQGFEKLYKWSITQPVFEDLVRTTEIDLRG
jgi:dTDP-L-rhamnose 4-epimerase